MTKEEFQTLKCLEEKLNNEVIELFDYIKNKYVDVLAFGKDSRYGHYDIDEDIICIEYYDDGYDCYDSRVIAIPINDFVSDSFKWVDNWANNIYIERKKREENVEKRIEERERKELQRLKEKYGEL